MLPQLNPNEEDRIVAILIGIIVAVFVLYGGLLMLAAFAHGFNTVVDWFMR